MKGLIDLHDGHVTVHSDGLTKGATFSIYLPFNPQLSGPSSEKGEHFPQKGNKCRIVVIEDNLDVAEALRMWFDLDGYEVRVTHNGPQGVELVRHFQPAVVICDIVLSGMDGYQVAQALRRGNLHIPPYLIALTGYGREKDKYYDHEAGFDLHLIKPLNFDDISRVLYRFSF